MRFGTAIATCLLAGLASVAALRGGAQEVDLAGDAHRDSTIVTEVAEASAKRGSEVVRGEAEARQEEPSSAAFAAKSAQQRFIEADRDGDGGISRDEWMRWRERAFAGQNKETLAGSTAPDRDSWQGAPQAATQPASGGG